MNNTAQHETTVAVFVVVGSREFTETEALLTLHTKEKEAAAESEVRRRRD